eukprot:maker-scaffold1754_size28903-snap-gene-0.8 protein:Tk09273 transcript:maker-scaffold1754_size28903-snap-gene-0.8-mRNA-1 annotation:"run and fyve domain-containing protein 2 isoform x3"
MLSYSRVSKEDYDSGAHRPSIPGKRDPVIIERSNLVNILQLVIKEVIDSSLQFGRQLDSDHIPLQHFFIVLEHALKHGLRPKKGLLGPKKELWDLLQLVEKRNTEAVDITASVRDLPTVKTNLGRARAWLRLALMQKKLADYFRILVEQRDDILSEYYEPRALLRSEEASLIVGLLLSLNVVDCNLCVKEEDLDSQQGVIDFSLYLRNKKDVGREEDLIQDRPDSTSNQMTAVLDQKNYIEELNRHLTATVTNLETKVESLTTTNALMREDLAIHKNSLGRFQCENRRLLLQVDVISSQKQVSSNSEVTPKSVKVESSESSDSTVALKSKLADMSLKTEKLEHELKLQTSMKAEMEMAMKLLERDIHEKQDTIVGLRGQLEEIKDINLDIFAALKAESSEFCVRLDELEEERIQREKLRLQLEADLQIEKGRAKRLEKSKVEDEILIYDLRKQNERLKHLEKAHNTLTAENVTLSKRVQDSGKALEELGDHLSRSKLEADKLRERIAPLGQWQKDADVEKCHACDKPFGMARRKHHCRSCGRIFCTTCSDNRLGLPSSSRPTRVCDSCYLEIMQQGTL